MNSILFLDTSTNNPNDSYISSLQEYGSSWLIKLMRTSSIKSSDRLMSKNVHMFLRLNDYVGDGAVSSAKSQWFLGEEIHLKGLLE